MVANLDHLSTKPLEDKNVPTVAFTVALTVAFLAALLPADHLADWEALTPINAVDQGVTASTRPRLVDATKAFPICQNLIKPIGTRLPEEKKDWPQQLTPYIPSRCNLTETGEVSRSGNRTTIPANLRQEDLHTLHTGHAAVTIMPTKATKEVIDIKAANRLVTGILGPHDTIHTNRFAGALLPRTPTLIFPPDPTHQQDCSRRGPHFKASPSGDINPPPRLLLPGARLQRSSCHGLQAPHPTSKLLQPRTPHSGSGTITLLKRHQPSRNLDTLNENERTLNEIKDTPNENKKAPNGIESPEAFAFN